MKIIIERTEVPHPFVDMMATGEEVEETIMEYTINGEAVGGFSTLVFELSRILREDLGVLEGLFLTTTRKSEIAKQWIAENDPRGSEMF